MRSDRDRQRSERTRWLPTAGAVLAFVLAATATGLVGRDRASRHGLVAVSVAIVAIIGMVA